jgi:glycosyltransferase involved in cell wall biosynthesis
VRDGIEGFIVPIRSSDALAEKLELLNGDRDLLEAMRAAALERARQCTWQKYRELLAATVEEIMTPGKDCNCV